MHQNPNPTLTLCLALVLAGTGPNWSLAVAQDAAPAVPRRVGPAELPAGLRPPFATEVLPKADATGFQPASLPGLPYDTSFACLKWFPQGPGLTTNGDCNISPDHPTSGGVSAIAPHPTNPDILYIGTVNGGVWRSDNATSTSISWRSLTDQQLSLSIGGLALDPADASGQTLVAGIGRRSSFGGAGGAQIGLLRTTDGGLTWTRVGAAALAGRSIYNVAVRGGTMLLAVVSTDNGTSPGLYRTTDGGANFTNLSGFAGSGLPAGAVTHLAADPGNSARFYTHVTSTGVYRSDNSGATWVNISGGLAAANVGQLALAAFSRGGTNVVYAAELAGTSRVYWSANLGTNWTQMDSIQANTSRTFNGFTADPLDPNKVYLSGLFVRANFPYSGRVVRGDASLPAGSQWTSIASTNGTGNGTAPHTDSRALVFNAANALVEGDDGGIYELPVANTGNNGTTSRWRSLNSNLQNNEMHSLAYDRVAKIFIGGAQDTGFQEQVRAGQGLWNKTSNGDGGDAAVDTVSIPGQTIRYGSSQELGGFYRATYNANNVRQNLVFPALTPLGTSPAMNGQFVNPIKVNAANPQRLVFGAANGVYESSNQGNTVTNISANAANSLAKMAYGGRIGTVTNADVLLVGIGNAVLIRTNAAGPLAATPAAFPGGAVRSIVLNPADWLNAFVAGTTQMLVTANAGASWTDVTGNLVGAGTFQSVEYLTLPGGDAIVAGTDLGAHLMRTAMPGVWKTLGTNLPNAPVYDTHYDPVGNVLAVSTFGRGAWLYDFNPAMTNVVTTRADSGPGSLRQALLDANANNCPTYITLSVTGVIRALTDLPAITAAGPVTIFGPGTNTLTISGGNTTSLLKFGANTTNRVVGLTLANGFSANHGAAIQNSGLTVLENCLLVSNAVVNSFGGAICNFPGGTVLATNCVFTANTIRGGNGVNRGAGSNGGPGGGGAGMGGAIYSEGEILSLSGCKFFNNAAFGGNGGNGDGNSFNSDPGSNGGFPNAGLGGAAGQPGSPGGFGGGGGGGAGSFDSGLAGGAGGFGGGGGAGGARGSGGDGGAAGAGGNYGGAAGPSFASHSGGGGGGAGLGGALFSRLGTVTLVNCMFMGNVATNGVGGFGSFGGGNGANGQGSGAALFNLEAKLVAAGNTYSGNLASTGEPDVDASTLVTTLADSGPGSLRQAICNAGARPGPDTVTFAPHLSGGVIALTSASLVITNQAGPLAITATNLPGGLTLSGENARHVFIVMPGQALTLDSLTLSNGHAVTLFDIVPLGGGLWNFGGTTVVRRCTFVDNAATFGGALMCYQGSLTAENCTFSGNQSTSSGGAIETGSGVPQVALRHCTIVSNTASGSGGGVRFNTGSATMTHCLIAGNTAPTGPDVNVVNGAYASATYNLLGNGTTSGLAAGVNGNQLGTAAAPIDPRLGPLGNNGGPTRTLALLPGSPAIDAGDPGFDGTGLTDQRGASRVVYGRVDIGAVEAPAGLHSYYSFDSFGGPDALGFSTLTYQGDGPAWWNTDHRGQVNSAIALNDPGFGTNNYYRINTAHDPTNSARGLGLQGDFTVSAWIFPTALGSWKVLLGATGPGDMGAIVFGLLNNTAYMAFWGNDIQGSRAIPPNTWTHLAFSYRRHGGEMALYVNGLLDTADVGRTNTVRNGDVLLGYSEALAGSYFQGFVDEFAVYSVALSPNQIEALANNSIFPTNALPEPALATFATTNAWAWNVREIYNHTVPTYSRAFAEAIATAPQLGSSSNYTSLVINRRDPETNPGPGAGFFGNDAPWAVNNRTPQGLINGDDDRFVLAARATIVITAEDDYTFGFNTDDGARLRVLGAVFKSSSFVGDTNYPNPAIPAHRGDLLNNPRPTAASGTLGVTHLRPGSYEVEFLTWENFGGSFAEVFAASGAKTTVDGTFHLLSPGLFQPPATLTLTHSSPTAVGVTWTPATGCLEAAPEVTGPWSLVTEATNGQTIVTTPARQFFRVAQ
jgi:predicted outer membrane repeat protein